jgi:hypothetical protein
MQLTIPGGSKSGVSLDVDLTTFENLVKKAINETYVQNPATGVPPVS